MGVDVATYRSRIGCCRQNTGHDVVHFTVNINFSHTVKWLSVLPLLLFVLLMFINQNTLFGKGTYDLNVLDLSRSSSVFTGFHLYIAAEKKTPSLKCPGAVFFIGILLIIAGIEINPGPLHKEDKTQEKTEGTLLPMQEIQNRSSETHTQDVYQGISETSIMKQYAEKSTQTGHETQDSGMSSGATHLTQDADKSSETDIQTQDGGKSSETDTLTQDGGKSYETDILTQDGGKSSETDTLTQDGGKSSETYTLTQDGRKSSETVIQTQDASKSAETDTLTQEGGKSSETDTLTQDGGKSSETDILTHDGGKSSETDTLMHDTNKSSETFTLTQRARKCSESDTLTHDSDKSSETDILKQDIRNSSEADTLTKDTRKSFKKETLTRDTGKSSETEAVMQNVEKAFEAKPLNQDVDNSSETNNLTQDDRKYSETDTDVKKDKNSYKTDNETQDVEKPSELEPQSKNAVTSSDDTFNYERCSKPFTSIQALEQHAYDIRDRMGLAGYFPGKITLEDTSKISIKPKGNTAKELPWLLLQELIMVNFEARDLCPHAVHKQEAEQKDDGSEESGDDDDDDDSEDGEINDDNEFRFNINILKNHDIFMTLFNCCDHSLKQVLVSKLFSCRLAVPLIYPTFQSDSICFSLWPLRCIHLDLKEEENVSMFLGEHPQKVVSFIRISRPTFSKSTLLNAILSNQSTERHPTFYDNNCLLGDDKRELTNGLVEASWYMPSGQSDEIFQSTIMFTNLRGNALNHKKQMNVLTAMSNCLVVIIDCRVLHAHLDFLKYLKAETKSTLLLLTGRKSRSVSKQYEQDLEGMEIVRLFDKKQGKNLAALKLEMRKHISDLLQKGPYTDLGKCALLADKNGVPVDEFLEICETTKKDAESLVHKLEQFPPIDMKKHLLPLHGKLWMDISEYTKNLKRTDTTSSQQYNDQDSPKTSIWRKEPIKAKIKELRQEQLRLGDKSLAKMFIQYLEKHLDNAEYISHFLQWIRYNLDNKSYLVSQTLMTNYHRCWEEYNKSKQTDTEENVEKLKDRIRVEKQKLEDVSLGVDHILRDVGQLFESNRLLDRDCISDAWFNSLPEIAAKLLLRGYPLQLMDGDASNVPTTWIEAVFQSCKELIGDKSVYIISILGVQSSGKSTLLNCLFGLQFPVSAGRCTKGAYMQMLPVDQTSGLAVDYIIVLDTEGLRAPELVVQYNHDNELATFAVGIADMTIVNIKGENTSEVKDVLEIVIHALLRLKLANANLRFNTSCLFVHQNVSASNASTKMQESLQKLVELLDDVTKEAAVQLGIKDTKTFRQVIQFDIQTDVWYVPDLWNGDPPMAHINPGYSRKIASIKNAIMEQVRSNVSTSRNLTTTIVQILDLWNGILSEDFVFSFRNSLEVKAYNIMESEYRKHTWTLQEFQMKWVLHNRDQIGDASTEKEFDIVFREKSDTMQKNLKFFFENSKYKQELIKWKDLQLISFTRYVSNLMSRTKTEFAEIRDQKILQEKTRKMNSEHLKDINEQAKALAKSLKGRKPSEKDLEAHFDEMWSKWLQRLSPAEYTDIEPLETRIYNILRDFKTQERSHIYQEVARQNLSLAIDHLTSFTDCLDCGFETHIHIRRLASKSEIMNIQKKCLVKTEQFQQQLFADVDLQISEYTNHRNVRFHDGHLDQLLDMIDSKINKYNDESDSEFEFLPHYRAMIMVFVSKYVLHVFTEVNERYDNENSPKAIIEKYKSTAWSFFRNLVDEKTHDIIVATFVSEAMKNKINETLQQHVSITIESRIRAYFSHFKYSLIVKILDYLADQENFNKYKEYLNSPYSYTLQWVTEHTNDRFFSSHEYVNIVSDYVEEHIEIFKTEIKEAATKCKSLDERKMELFLSSIKKISIPDHTAKQMCEYELNDIDDFLSELSQMLSLLQTKMSEEHKSKSPSSIEWEQSPYKRIMQGLWGCKEVCPFCGEPCQKMEDHDENNEPHTCIQHRPQGIQGIRRHYSQKLVIESCSFLVQSDHSASCSVFKDGCRIHSDCESEEEVYHPYQNYKKYLPDWDIAPSSDMESSKYWMWFMVRFSKELAVWRCAKEPDIPESWKSISKQEARDSLRSCYGY